MKISDEFAPYFLEKEQREKFEKLHRKLMAFARKEFGTHYFRGESGGIPPSGDASEDFVSRAFKFCMPKNRKYIMNTGLITKYYIVKEGLNWEIVSKIFIRRHWGEVFRKNRILLREDWKDYLQDIKKEFKKDFGRLSSILRNSNKIFEFELYNYIKREVSRESRLKRNNQTKNESFYEARNQFYNPFNTATDNRENARQEMIAKRRKQVVKEIVQEFIKSTKGTELDKFIKGLTAEYNFKELIGKITNNSSKLMKELVKNELIYDSTGQATEKAKQLKSPGKLEIKHKFEDKKAKNYLFSILNINEKFYKPRIAAFCLGMKTGEYYKFLRKLRRAFLEFLKEWRRKGNNEELLQELGLFQNINLK